MTHTYKTKYDNNKKRGGQNLTQQKNKWMRQQRKRERENMTHIRTKKILQKNSFQKKKVDAAAALACGQIPLRIYSMIITILCELQCVAVCCSVLLLLQCVALRCSPLQSAAVRCSVLWCVAVCVAVCVAACRSVCCSVCCSALRVGRSRCEYTV